MSYNKTSIVKWVIIYLVIGGAIYGLVYYLFFTKEEGYTNQPEQYQNSSMIKNMKIQILKQGSGQTAKSGDTITVHYVGTFENGIKFDSSVDRNSPLEFKLGENSVIKGWELGIPGMKVGEKRKLTIPPELAYGATGYPPVIPPNAKLIFEVELLKIN